MKGWVLAAIALTGAVMGGVGEFVLWQGGYNPQVIVLHGPLPAVLAVWVGEALLIAAGAALGLPL